MKMERVYEYSSETLVTTYLSTVWVIGQFVNFKDWEGCSSGKFCTVVPPQGYVD
jgi:hypothetical protein